MRKQHKIPQVLLQINPRPLGPLLYELERTNTNKINQRDRIPTFIQTRIDQITI